MKRNSKILNILLATGSIVCLVLLWWPRYFLTGDGPCHLYNAGILRNFVWNLKDAAFYSKFYQVVAQPNPNWLSHILLSLPLAIFSGPVSEKLFLTFYAGLMAGGFYLLLKKISGGTSYWLSIIFLFVFHHTLSKGFYNFSLGTAFYFWMVWSWLRFTSQKTSANGFMFFCFSGMLFFTQLLPFVFGVITCACLVLSGALAETHSDRNTRLRHLFKNWIILFMITAPFIALAQWFTSKEGGLRLALRPHPYRLIELIQFKYIVNATHDEYFFAGCAGLILCTVSLIALVTRLRGGLKFHQYDGFILTLLFAFFVYLFFPEDFLGRVILISMRVQLFVFILAACCIAYILPQKIKNAAGGLLFLCFIGLSITRLAFLTEASEALADYNSASRYIAPYSVVLPLDFAPGGKNTKGAEITDRNYLFSHAAQYMGLEKPLIFLDNYEANAGYFPLSWTHQANPYAQRLNCGDGIEAQPPCADIAAYETNSGIKINYIILWGYDTSFANKARYPSLASQIRNGYHEIYSTPSRRTVLFERNK